MSDSIKVSTDDLSACAVQYNTISEDFKNKANSITEKINSVTSVWQGNFSEDLDDTISKFKTSCNNIYENCITLKDFINQAVEKYINVDKGLIPASEIGNGDFPAGVTPIYIEMGMILDTWRAYEVKSPNGFSNYNGKGNCTWYADNRWSQQNPDYPLKFTRSSGRDAKNWDDCIDKNYFNVNPINNNAIQSNAIAVRESGTFGHVAYIEQVRDGMVYYTEDGQNITRPSTWAKDANGEWLGPKVQCCTVAKFQRKFSKIITAK